MPTYARTRLAQLIAKEEGFGIPGAIPTVRRNPGDLLHCPHCSHEGIGPNDVGIIDTIEHGWADLERQLTMYAMRGMTIHSMIWDDYAPPPENDSGAYVAALCAGLKLPPDTLVSNALKVPAIPES